MVNKKGYSIRQLAIDIDTNFENVRRLYHDHTIKYDRVLLAKICDKLNVGIDELLIIIDDAEEDVEV